MIKIEKDLMQIPTSLTENECLDSLKRIVQDRKIISKNKKNSAGILVERKNIDEEIYKGRKHHINSDGFGDVQQKLKDLYNNKCAYCESYTFKPRIEHYRPKGNVKEYNFSTNKFKKVNSHNGYYWLVYEWSNLVPSCHHCNTIEDAKSDRFPIIGTRVIHPTLDSIGLPNELLANQAPLIDEQPYLLHPEIDNPEDYLGFEFQVGEVKLVGIDSQNRGKMTILICNLDRDDLKTNWYDKFGEYLVDLERSFLIFSSNNNQNELKNNIFGSLQKIYDWLGNSKKQYIFLHRFIYQNFKTIFAPPILPSEVCPKLHEIYDEFYKNNPI